MSGALDEAARTLDGIPHITERMLDRPDCARALGAPLLEIAEETR